MELKNIKIGDKIVGGEIDRMDGVVKSLSYCDGELRGVRIKWTTGAENYYDDGEISKLNIELRDGVKSTLAWKEHKEDVKEIKEKLAEVGVKDKSIERIIKESEKDAKVIEMIAEGKSQGAIEKEVGTNSHKIVDTKRDADKKAMIMELKNELIESHLEISKEANRILKDKEFAKLKSLDGYKLSLVSKINEDASKELTGDDLLNLKQQNLAILVQKITVNAREHKESPDSPYGQAETIKDRHGVTDAETI